MDTPQPVLLSFLAVRCEIFLAQNEWWPKENYDWGCANMDYHLHMRMGQNMSKPTLFGGRTSIGQLFSGLHYSTCILTPNQSPEVMTADCRKMEEGSDELERKIEKLNAQLARQTARAEKVHWRQFSWGCNRVSVGTAGPLHFG